jgi:hypothetical protein
MAGWLRIYILLACLCLSHSNVVEDSKAPIRTDSSAFRTGSQVSKHDLQILERMKKALTFEESALAYLQRYTRRRIERGSQLSLTLEKQFEMKSLNASDRKPWVNKQKIVRDCDVDAYEMTKFDPSGFCQVAKAECRSSGTLNYLELPFCLLPNHTWIAVLLMIFWLMVLVLWLSTTVDYICPNLVMITHVLGIRDSVAGITFLGESPQATNAPSLLSFLFMHLSGSWQQSEMDLRISSPWYRLR